jgi:hypothetical protein
MKEIGVALLTARKEGWMFRTELGRPSVRLVVLVLASLGLMVPQGGSAESPQPDPKSNEEKRDSEALAAAKEFHRLWRAGDVAGLLEMTDVPHYRDVGARKLEVIPDREEMGIYLRYMCRDGPPKDLTVKFLKVRSWGASREMFSARQQKLFDPLLRKDDRLVFVESTATWAPGKHGTNTRAMLFRLRDGKMRWMGHLSP